MLEPFFFQIPFPDRWRSDLTFRVLGFARVEAYTLVRWQFGKGDEFAIGETLYLDRQQITTGGGLLPLYAPPEPVNPNLPQDGSTSRQNRSVWSRMDGAIGQFGVPPAIAIALRDPANYVGFE